jgi:tetratricopeptide (TPR) repeat protein
LLGAAYKGMMDDNKGDESEEGYRIKAIEAYLEGFDADPRDYYPGINALTLMFFGDVDQDIFDKYLPLVQFAVDRQLKKKPDDYWLQATRLELAILGNNAKDASTAFSKALATNPEEWMRESTKANLEKLYQKKLDSADETELKWLKQIVDKL